MRSFCGNVPSLFERGITGSDQFALAEDVTKLDLSRLSILLIDDNKFIRHLVSEILQGFGVKSICKAASADDAFVRMKARIHFDLVISDWSMEPKDGLYVLRSIRGRKTPLNPRTPFVMLTGECRQEKVIEALSEGASSYIIKPISAKLLMSHLLKLIVSDRGTCELD